MGVLWVVLVWWTFWGVEGWWCGAGWSCSVLEVVMRVVRLATLQLKLVLLDDCDGVGLMLSERMRAL